MGFRDKPLLPLAGKPLIEHVISFASPQVTEWLISVNRNASAYTYLALPLIADISNAFAGPLIGIHSAMVWLQQNRTGQYSHLACFAADVPCFPTELVATLRSALQISEALVAVSRNGKQIQPLFSLWSLSAQPVIAAAIAAGLYGPKLVFPKLKTVEVNFDAIATTAFSNINTEHELQRLEAELTST